MHQIVFIIITFETDRLINSAFIGRLICVRAIITMADEEGTIAISFAHTRWQKKKRTANNHLSGIIFFCFYTLAPAINHSAKDVSEHAMNYGH